MPSRLVRKVVYYWKSTTWIYRFAILGVLSTVATVISDIWLDPNFQLAANVSLIYIFVLTSAFTLLYLFRSKWWTNRIGKAYLTKSIVTSLVLLQIVLATWWSLDYPFRQQIRFIIYTWGALVYLPMLATLWGEQRRDRKQARERADCDCE